MAGYAPDQPDGVNETKSSPISEDGDPETGVEYTIPAREGRAVRLCAGDALKVTTLSGHQVCDFFAVAANSPSEFVSMEHCRTAWGRIYVQKGDALVSNRRRALLTLVEDTSPGVHDTLIAACDHTRYVELGCSEYHDNCADNFKMALSAIGIVATHVPAPLNLWMNIPVDENGGYAWTPPVAKAEDHVVLRAEVDCIAVMSACPQDMTAVNGDGAPLGSLRFSVVE